MADALGATREFSNSIKEAQEAFRPVLPTGKSCAAARAMFAEAQVSTVSAKARADNGNDPSAGGISLQSA